jgi:hypothetical protein
MVRSKFEVERAQAIMLRARDVRNEALQDLQLHVELMTTALCPDDRMLVNYIATELEFERALTAYVGAQATERAMREGWLVPENVALLTEEHGL